MKKYILLLLILTNLGCYAQNISICSWNLKDFGKSKSVGELKIIANILKSFDVIAVQEVVAGPGGIQAIVKLVNQMNASGINSWAYAVSAITSGTSYKSERYAFIWSVDRVKKVDEPWLENKYALLIDREPYYGRFKKSNKIFTLVSFHALTKSKQPETEIKYFKFLPDLYPTDNLIFCGDFNLPQSHSVFNPLKKIGYAAALIAQKTSLRQKCINDDCLASEFDNFYFNTAKVNLKRTGIIHFYKAFENLKAARLISDHVPIFFDFSLN